MAFATMNASPPRTCRMRNAPPGREKPHAKCSPWKGKTACEMPPLEGKNRMRNAPPWKGKTAYKMLPLERKSTATCEMPLLERKSTAACEMPLLERKSTAACEMPPPGKGIHRRMRNVPSRKGNPQLHAKCPLLERESTAACEMLPPGKGFTSN